MKQVRKDEAMRVRCNKYDHPYPILLAGKEVTKPYCEDSPVRPDFESWKMLAR